MKNKKTETKPKFDGKLHIGRLYLVTYKKTNGFFGYTRLKKYLGYLVNISENLVLEFSVGTFTGYYYTSPTYFSINPEDIIFIEELKEKEDAINLKVLGYNENHN